MRRFLGAPMITRHTHPVVHVATCVKRVTKTVCVCGKNGVYIKRKFSPMLDPDNNFSYRASHPILSHDVIHSAPPFIII